MRRADRRGVGAPGPQERVGDRESGRPYEQAEEAERQEAAELTRVQAIATPRRMGIGLMTSSRAETMTAPPPSGTRITF